MPYLIEINGAQDSPQHVRLVGGSATVGSSSANQVPIFHAEVSERALLIDVRGDDFWVQNLNPYSIYVGMEEVTPNGWSPCELGEPIQLTKSVSLSVVQEEQVQKTSARAKLAGEANGAAKGLDISKLIQIVIIVGCFAGAALILLNPKDDVGGVIDREFDFNQTVRDLEFEAANNIEYRTVRRYLQQAWMADRRFRSIEPDTVRKSYELLVNHRLIRENPAGDETLNEISEYAKRRLATLSFKE